MALMDWLRERSKQLLDLDRDRHIGEMADHVWKELTTQRQAFDFQRSMMTLGAFREDNPLVAARVYEIALQKAWKDGVITDNERKSLARIAELLHLDSQKCRAAEWNAGVNVFKSALEAAVVDGELDAAEAAQLTQIAAGMGTNVRTVMTRCFGEWGQSILRSLFISATGKQTFSFEDWSRLVRAASAFGMSEVELQAAVRTQAERFVELILAEAKSDREVTDHERQNINWLLELFGVSPAFCRYVADEISSVERYTRLKAGHLPSIQAPWIALRAGEIVHANSESSFSLVRQRRGAQHTEWHQGVATITDARLIFSSNSKTLDIAHRRIVSLLPLGGGIEVRAGGKAGGCFHFPNDADWIIAVYETAVGKANQIIVERLNEAPTRHIARDVRQRIWQKYGGRCADCGADQYLEFDHIVPIAKGGSSGEANVQLLCRKCNLKKSDWI